MAVLDIQDLHASVGGRPILKGVFLSVNEGEMHAVMGPNGSGKSTLANVLAGNPKCVVSQGRVLFNGRDLLSLTPDERARQGVFTAFQHPVEIHGLKFYTFLKRASEALHGNRMSVLEFRKMVSARAQEFRLPEDFDARDVNFGFSGGEKKRGEVLQLSVLKPSLALLDEIDSGLDVDSLKLVAHEINNWASRNGAAAVLLTHYKRILDCVTPDFVHIMVGGRIVKSGGRELASEIDEQGYEKTVAKTSELLEQGASKEEFYTSLLKLKKEKAMYNEGTS